MLWLLSRVPSLIWIMISKNTLAPERSSALLPMALNSFESPGKKMQVCSFLWVYYGYPPSYYEGINVDEVRYRCGAAIARKDDVEADFCGRNSRLRDWSCHWLQQRKEDSLYAAVCKIHPYVAPQLYAPKPGNARTGGKMKLIPNPALIRGKRGIFLDDSIVRGTQLSDNTLDLYNEGIKEVHMRIACPPLTYPCEYLNFSRSRQALELATRKAIKDGG
jgi:amidophosphoribosyltransferase